MRCATQTSPLRALAFLAASLTVCAPAPSIAQVPPPIDELEDSAPAPPPPPPPIDSLEGAEPPEQIDGRGADAPAVSAHPDSIFYTPPGRFDLLNESLFHLNHGTARLRRDLEPIPPVELYRLVGRPDLAATFARRRNVRAAVIAIGLGLIASSYVVLYGPLEGDQSGQDSRRDVILQGYVVGSSFAGLVLTVGGLIVDPHPISSLERRRLVHLHNEALAPLAPASAPPRLGVSLRF